MKQEAKSATIPLGKPKALRVERYSLGTGAELVPLSPAEPRHPLAAEVGMPAATEGGVVESRRPSVDISKRGCRPERNVNAEVFERHAGWNSRRD
jgi:hypothetical protein